jgi:hypothetical protein
VGKLFQIDPLQHEVFLEIPEGLNVGRLHGSLRIGDEDNPINSAEHQLTGRVVVNLARDGVELEGDVHPSDGSDVDRKQIEEDRPVALGGERDHLPALTAFKVVMDPLQVCRLAAQARTVVHDLGVELAQRVVEEDHLRP